MSFSIKEIAKEELFLPGHRACSGCGEAIATRLILKATGKNVIVVVPTGCLETFAIRFPSSPWMVPVLHSLFENAAAVASGVYAALKATKKEDIKAVAIGGDGSTFDIGLGMLSGMVERGDNVTYICLDNGAYMNTGVQRSSATPIGASTTTSPAGEIWLGKGETKKDVPSMMVANGSRYVATATIGYPWDLMRKVRKAVDIEGPSYVQVYTPCPTGEGFSSEETIKISRLGVETAIYPLYELENGQLLSSFKIKTIRPVEEYIKKIRWFRHLFSRREGEEIIKRIQRYANYNIEKYNLKP